MCRFIAAIWLAHTERESPVSRWPTGSIAIMAQGYCLPSVHCTYEVSPAKCVQWWIERFFTMEQFGSLVSGPDLGKVSACVSIERLWDGQFLLRTLHYQSEIVEARTWSSDAVRIPRILGMELETARRNHLRINMAVAFQCPCHCSAWVVAGLISCR